MILWRKRLETYLPQSNTFVRSYTKSVDLSNNFYVTLLVRGNSGVNIIDESVNITTILNNGIDVADYYSVILKFDKDGSLIWSKIIGTANPSDQIIYNSDVDNNNDLYIIGRTEDSIFDISVNNSGNNLSDIMLLKVKGDDGSILFSKNLTDVLVPNNTNTLNDRGYGVLVTKDNNLLVKGYINEICKNIKNNIGKVPKYILGTMIELPRAALVADEIAKVADFFSFGTNDLTQTTYGISRDDSSRFLDAYLEKNILDIDPFVSLDIKGVGQLIEIATNKSKLVNEEIKLGICGEHGGDPNSVNFCNNKGLDYVSCSPFRIPIARLAAAQACILKD